MATVTFAAEGNNVSEAVSVVPGLATLAAVAVMVVCVASEEGAVYRPVDEIVPIAGLRDQVTAVLELPVTVAVSCWVWPGERVAAEGVTFTVTFALPGITPIWAVSVLFKSAMLWQII